jgi:general secretion pathway protein J
MMTPHRHPSSSLVRQRAFTLVELLVAISILAIVAVLGWRGLDGIMRARFTLTAQMETTRGMQLAFAQMQSDCEHMVDPATMGTRPYLVTEPDHLSLVRTVFVDGEPTRLQVVTYRVKNGVLTRRESANTRELQQLDILWQAAISNADPGTAVALQSGVQAMVIRVWENGWKVSASAGPGPLVRTAPTGLEVALGVLGQETSMSKAFLLGGL